MVIKRPTTFDIKSAAHRINVLLKFQEVIFDDTVNNENKLKFKKLSDRAKTPVHATEGSVGYDPTPQCVSPFHRRVARL